MRTAQLSSTFRKYIPAIPVGSNISNRMDEKKKKTPS